jgi:hypothetical protein
MFLAQSPVLVDGILDLASYMADMAHPSFVGQVTPTNSDSIAIATSAEETATRGGGKLKDETSPPLEISGTLWSPGGY